MKYAIERLEVELVGVRCRLESLDKPTTKRRYRPSEWAMTCALWKQRQSDLERAIALLQAADAAMMDEQKDAAKVRTMNDLLREDAAAGTPHMIDERED